MTVHTSEGIRALMRGAKNAAYLTELMYLPVILRDRI